MFGIRVKAKDVLNVNTKKAISVFCPFCKEHIYYIKNDKKGTGLNNLKHKTNKEEIKNYNCFLCNRDIRVYNGNDVLLKTNMGYWK